VQAVYLSISIIYSVSNLELDEFKNSIYVARAAHLSRNNAKDFAEWNWLKQHTRGSRSALASARASRLPKTKKPPDCSEGF
jgi:hypothetical protein